MSTWIVVIFKWIYGKQQEKCLSYDCSFFSRGTRPPMIECSSPHSRLYSYFFAVPVLDQPFEDLNFFFMAVCCPTDWLSGRNNELEMLSNSCIPVSTKYNIYQLRLGCRRNNLLWILLIMPGKCYFNSMRCDTSDSSLRK